MIEQELHLGLLGQRSPSQARGVKSRGESEGKEHGSKKQ